MAQRQPTRHQTSIGSDVITNNNVDEVVGLGNVPFSGPVIPGSVPVANLNGATIDWVTNLPVSVLPPVIPATNLDASILNQLIIDRQGLVFRDRQGGVAWARS